MLHSHTAIPNSYIGSGKVEGCGGGAVSPLLFRIRTVTEITLGKIVKRSMRILKYPNKAVKQMKSVFLIGV